MAEFDKETARRVQKAMEDYFAQLDAIVPDGITSKEWLPFVENIVGDTQAYEEWCAEVWEPLSDDEMATMAGGEPPTPAIFKS